MLHQGGGPETRSGTVQSLKCCPCHEAPKCCAWQHQTGKGPNQVLRLAASREGGAPKRARVPEPEVLPLPAETSREAPKCCAWQHQPETRSGTVQSLKCCPCQQKRAARLPSAAPGSISIKGGGPRNALGYRPEPEVLPLPAETSREAPKCCALVASSGGPRNALGHRPEPEVLRLPSAAPGRGPETRSGTVQSLKCCPCQQKRASRLPSAAPGSIKPRNALGHRPEPEVLPLPAETSREAPKCCAWQHQGRGARNALRHRPEPEVLPLPAETSREAPKCCAWQHQHQGGGAPKRARAPSRA